MLGRTYDRYLIQVVSQVLNEGETNKRTLLSFI